MSVHFGVGQLPQVAQTVEVHKPPQSLLIHVDGAAALTPSQIGYAILSPLISLWGRHLALLLCSDPGP